MNQAVREGYLLWEDVDVLVQTESLSFLQHFSGFNLFLLLNSTILSWRFSVFMSVVPVTENLDKV